MTKREPHPLAGKTVALKSKDPKLNGAVYRLEDWWVNVSGDGKGWGECFGNPACLIYARRSGTAGLPPNDEVVYGKVGAFGHLVHVSEIGEEL